MKTIIVNVESIRIQKTGVSYYGNPHHWCSMTTTDGEVIWGRTCTNGSIGYGLENYLNKPSEVEYHTTRAGNIIFDFVRNRKS